MLNGYKIIDLTLTLDEELPCTWPGAMPFQRKNWNWYEKVDYLDETIRNNKLGSYFTEWLAIDEHTGTHFDAPSHFIPKPNSGIVNASQAGSITGEKVDLKKMVGKAVVIDLTYLIDKGKDGSSPLILPSDIKNWEKKHGDIKGEIVLFYTGWDQYYISGEGGDYYIQRPLTYKKGCGWPSPSIDTMKYLYEKGVTCVGTDGTSMGSTQDGTPVHIFGLSKEIVYIEALCNLNKLAARDNYFIFLPIKVKGSSGCPGRAVAFVKDE